MKYIHKSFILSNKLTKYTFCFINKINIIEVHLFVCYIRDTNILQRTGMEHVKISIICCKLTKFCFGFHLQFYSF